jgi:sugar lactone lactonase YvrE
MNEAGCDSVVTLNLTLKATSTSSNSIVLLANQLPYTWNGLTFNAAGTQTKTGLTNAAGCDSSASLTIALPPNISYNTPNTFNVGTLISPLIPTNTGGEIRSTTFSTFAGSGSIGSTDGTGTAASFKFPDNVIMDKSGNLFVADRSNHLIRKITPAGVVTTFAGNGTAASVDGTGTGASINFPSGLAFDTIGNLYVGERQGYKIRKITPNGVVTTLAGSGTKASVNGTGTAASFDFIEKITIDKSTNDLYVCEGNSRKIRKVTSLGVVTTFAGSGAYANSEGTGTAASFIDPLGITIDANKNLYVTSGELIFKITPSAVVTRYAGTPGTYGSADGTTTSATFNYGSGITIDASGNFYLGDLGGGKIRKISTSGIVSTISGIGSAGNPRGLVLDASGNNLYVADYLHKIRKIALGGGYTITPALPAGLSMDANTGIISGTPSMITAATDYTIIANNDDGSDSFNINIKVCTPTISSNSIAICPSALPYSWNGLTFNAAGTQTAHLTNLFGCDSAASLTVTLKATSSSSDSITINSTALPYSWNGLTFNAAGTKTAYLNNAAGCDSAATLTLSVTASTIAFHLKAMLQGLYLGNGKMVAAPFNADGVSPMNIADTITIELRENATPFNVIHTIKGLLDTSGNAAITFPGSVNGNSYYVVVGHRNSVAVWSANPVIFSTTTNYDFTNAITKAFGSNMAEDGGVFMLYSGDINQDGAIDFNDYPDLDISSINGDYGYLNYDLNGDSAVDFNDYPLLDINSIYGIIISTP